MTEISDLSRNIFAVPCCGPGKPFADGERKPSDCKRSSESIRRSNFALRVRPALLVEARKAVESQGGPLNQLITLALGEKVSAMRTEEYFEERTGRADPAKVSRILTRVDKGNPAVEIDRLPLEFSRKVKKKKSRHTTVSRWVESALRPPRSEEPASSIFFRTPPPQTGAILGAGCLDIGCNIGCS
jgi:hypothetical protein